MTKYSEDLEITPAKNPSWHSPSYVSDVSSLAALGHKVYTAALLQTFTSAPVATVLQNTTGGTFTWTYVSPGKYLITVSGIDMVSVTVTVPVMHMCSGFGNVTSVSGML